MPRSARDSAKERKGWCQGARRMAQGMHQGTRNAPKREEWWRRGKRNVQRACGIAPRIERVPRNEGDVAERARKDAKEQESASEKRRGNCKIRHRKSAEITICTQSYNIIGTFSTYVYKIIVLFLGALTHNSRFNSWRA